MKHSNGWSRGCYGNDIVVKIEERTKKSNRRGNKYNNNKIKLKAKYIIVLLDNTISTRQPREIRKETG